MFTDLYIEERVHKVKKAMMKERQQQRKLTTIMIF